MMRVWQKQQFDNMSSHRRYLSLFNDVSMDIQVLTPMIIGINIKTDIGLYLRKTWTITVRTKNAKLYITLDIAESLLLSDLSKTLFKIELN